MKKVDVNKLVSVIMPAYNAEKYLAEAIESIINQTYPFWEFLIIDDGSTDSTREIIQSYQKRDGRIRLIAKPKGGIAAALNLGIERSQGKYVARMDADDISLPNRLEKQVDYMERNGNIDVCATLYQIFSDKNKESFIPLTPHCDDEIKARMLFECVVGHPTIMFRKSTLMQGWRYDTQAVAEDCDLWTRMIPDIKFACIQEVLLYYRSSKESISHKKFNDILLSAGNSRRKCISRILKMDVDGYGNEHFGQVSNWGKISEPYFTFLRRELCLLYEIDSHNRVLNVLDRKSLRKVLCSRWRTMTDFLRPVLEILQEGNGSNIFDLSQVFDRKVLLEEYYDKFQVIERKHKEWLKKNRTFVICGMGERGKELLQHYLVLKRNNQIGWNLTLLIDKHVDLINMDGVEYAIKKPSYLNDLDMDIVLISSSIYYEEIRRELIEIGIDKEKIFSGNILCIL